MDLNKLLDLQELDNHIHRIKTELTDIPRQIEMNKSKLNAALDEEKSAHQQSDAFIKDKHAKELDLKSKEEEIKKLGSQLYSVKTNEQYKAIQSEINDSKNKISKLEDSLLVIMESLDKLKDELSKKKIIVQQEEKRFKEIEQKINTEKIRLENLLKDAENQHTTITQTIDPELLKLYNRISVKWNGTALATIRGNVCQGCSMTLPPQVIQEVRKNEQVVRCENCSRILYAVEIESV